MYVLVCGVRGCITRLLGREATREGVPSNAMQQLCLLHIIVNLGQLHACVSHAYAHCTGSRGQLGEAVLWGRLKHDKHIRTHAPHTHERKRKHAHSHTHRWLRPSASWRRPSRRRSGRRRQQQQPRERQRQRYCVQWQDTHTHCISVAVRQAAFKPPSAKA